MSSPLHRCAGRLAAALFHVVLVLVLGLAAMPAMSASKTFESPDAAMRAFGDAIAISDEDALKGMLGANFRALIPPIGADARNRFLAAWAKAHAIQQDGDVARIAVGDDGWTLPIPIVKSGAGWHFDTQAGLDEMRVRRIGRNELAVLQTMLAIYDAQLDYAREARDRDGLIAYAAKLSSSPGKHDGLYWPTKPGEEPSPIGAALATASSRNASPDGYYGYHYKLLTSQGSHAKGGARDYVVRGKLLGGFGVIAWPARYGDTGVMSFMVNQDGQVYERDLGPDSAAKAAAIKSFDPGPDWARVSP
jgi:hypothetical protein